MVDRRSHRASHRLAESHDPAGVVSPGFPAASATSGTTSTTATAPFDADLAPTASTDRQMPEQLSTKRLRRRLLEVAGVGVVVGLVVLLGPGLGGLRNRLAQASPGWLVAAVCLEVLSALSYVVLFRAVFCPRMRWGLSYQIGMAEQGANSVLSVSGIGGLALGAWALRRGGLSTKHIAR